MSGQATIVIPTTGTLSGLTAMQDANAALAALVGKNGGASAPANAGATGATTEAMMDWYDSANLLWKMRGTDNAGWQTLGAPGAGASPLWTPASLGKFLSPYSSGFRNRVINGDMRIDQANEGAAVTVAGAQQFSVDQWWGNGVAAAGQFSMQQLSATPPAGFKNYLRIKTTTADAAPAAGAYYYVANKIEGLNLIDFQLGQAGAIAFTTSAQMRASITGTFSGVFQNAATNRSYPWTCVISAANTWTPIIVTLTGDTTGTWAIDNTVGLAFLIDIGSGSTFRSTAATWQAGNFLGVTGAVRLISTLNATLDITGVSVEAGSYSATTIPPFEVRGYPEELVRCKRYFEAFGGTHATEIFATGQVVNGFTMFAALMYSTKRVAPVFIASAAGHFQITDSSYVGHTVVGFTDGFKGLNSLRLQADCSGGLTTAGDCSQLLAFSTLSARLSLDARL